MFRISGCSKYFSNKYGVYGSRFSQKLVRSKIAENGIAIHPQALMRHLKLIIIKKTQNAIENTNKSNESPYSPAILKFGGSRYVDGSMVFRLYDVWVYVFMVLWFCGFMVLGFSGFMVLWVYGVVLWRCYGFMVYGFRNLPNVNFMFFVEYWSRIHDFQDVYTELHHFSLPVFSKPVPTFRKLWFSKYWDLQRNISNSSHSFLFFRYPGVSKDKNNGFWEEMTGWKIQKAWKWGVLGSPIVKSRLY